MAVVTVWALFGAFLVFGFAWAVQVATPWGWLTKEQFDLIQGVLTGGIIAGLIADHVRRRMG